MPVNFHQLYPTTLPSKKKLKLFIESMFTQNGKTLESLDVIFCSDEYLLQINQAHLAHDYYTDIITFDLSASKKAPIVGELYISIERVKENAITNEKTFQNELHRVIFHGVLHLLGYKDKKKADITTMRSMEGSTLSAYFSSE
jgi:probable rRNA maturation factor